MKKNSIKTKIMKTKGIFSLTSVILLLLLIDLLIGCETKVIMPQNPEKIDTLSVQGDAELSVEPDKVELTIRIETYGKTATEAEQANRDYSNRVLEALKKEGITDIETRSYSLYPRYEWNDQQKKSLLEGYTANHGIKIISPDVKHIGKVMDVAVSAGATNVDNVEFTLSNAKKIEVQTKALETAAKRAQEKATVIARAMGTTVKKVTTISESATFAEPPIYYTSKIFNMASAERTPTPISPQKLDLHATINAIYTIG